DVGFGVSNGSIDDESRDASHFRSRGQNLSPSSDSEVVPDIHNENITRTSHCNRFVEHQIVANPTLHRHRCPTNSRSQKHRLDGGIHISHLSRRLVDGGGAYAAKCFDDLRIRFRIATYNVFHSERLPCPQIIEALARLARNAAAAEKSSPPCPAALAAERS